MWGYDHNTFPKQLRVGSVTGTTHDDGILENSLKLLFQALDGQSEYFAIARFGIGYEIKLHISDINTNNHGLINSGNIIQTFINASYAAFGKNCHQRKNSLLQERISKLLNQQTIGTDLRCWYFCLNAKTRVFL